MLSSMLTREVFIFTVLLILLIIVGGIIGYYQMQNSIVDYLTLTLNSIIF